MHGKREKERKETKREGEKDAWERMRRELRDRDASDWPWEREGNKRKNIRWGAMWHSLIGPNWF